MSDIIKRLQAQINRMTTDGEVEEAAIEEIDELRKWKENAFRAHPNIDLDIEELSDE